MAKKSSNEGNRLTLYLPEDVAERLKLAAVSQNRAASDVAAELLEKHLPRLQERNEDKEDPVHLNMFASSWEFSICLEPPPEGWRRGPNLPESCKVV